jgi:DHA2 family multidrug resistance protein-like MFS transporter
MILPPLMTAIGNGVVVILLRYLSEIHLCSLGMMSMALGLLGLAVGPFEGLILIVSLSLIGFGFGVFQTPNNRMILGAAPPDRSGNVSGTLAVTRTVGQAGGSSTVSLCLGLWGAVNGGSSALCIAALMAFICGLLGLLRIQRRVS